MAKLSRLRVGITTTEGERFVDGFADPDIPGLALTKIPTTGRRAVYSITHVPSGMRVVPQDMPRHVAARVLRFLGAAAKERGFSWDVSRTSLARNRGAFLEAARAARDLVQELTPREALAKQLDELEGTWVDKQAAMGGGSS